MYIRRWIFYSQSYLILNKLKIHIQWINSEFYLLVDPEVTANLYLNFAYPYWEGCVICSNFWVTQYVAMKNIYAIWKISIQSSIITRYEIS